MGLHCDIVQLSLALLLVAYLLFHVVIYKKLSVGRAAQVFTAVIASCLTMWAGVGLLGVSIVYIHRHIHPIENAPVLKAALEGSQLPVVTKMIPVSDQLIFAFSRHPLYVYLLLRCCFRILIGQGPPRRLLLTDHELGLIASRTSIAECLTACDKDGGEKEGFKYFSYIDPDVLGDTHAGMYAERCKAIFRTTTQAPVSSPSHLPPCTPPPPPSSSPPPSDKIPPPPPPPPSPELLPVSIEIRGEVFYPTDGALWELAKLFLGQNLWVLFTFYQHVIIHTFSDVTHVATRTHLPANHPLYELLMHHFDLSLALDSAVIWSDTFSPLSEKGMGRLFYGCFNRPLESFRHLLSHTTARFKYESGPHHGGEVSNDLRYGILMSEYYKVVKAFITSIIGQIPRDHCLMAWADSLAVDLPGFPSGRMLINDEDLLIHVLSTVIFRSSFMHAFHHNWGTRYLGYMISRIRIPPPTKTCDVFFDPSRVWLLLDYYKTYIMTEMFVAPRLGPLAQNIRYLGSDGRLHQNEYRAFRQTLRRKEQEMLKVYGEDASLDNVTTSLWY